MAPKPYFPTIRDSPVSLGRRLFDGFLNLIYPEECFVCSAALAGHQDCGICSRCWDNVLSLKITPPRCTSCGLPMQSFDDTPDHLCGNCILQMPPYAGARSFGYYTAELSKIIQELKFRGRRNLVRLLGPLLTAAFFESWSRDEFDLIVPVPLHPKRRRDRGYNQSELLARSLSRQIAVPLGRFLVRVRPTLPQVGLTDSERKENVRKAFRCSRPQQISGKRILLVDDVMTTGATAASAARALLDGGALRVSVLTVARAGKG
ncbi:MAG: ComF family protein [Acidobacteria bacterium]|nr:ComF family protein [Acidobacteriota bacterium]